MISFSKEKNMSKILEIEKKIFKFNVRYSKKPK